MTKHTPGPWVVDDGDGQFAFVSAESGKVVANVGWKRKDEHSANARLIAAAPELLEALQYLVAVSSDPGIACCLRDALVDARAAISKATGDA